MIDIYIERERGHVKNISDFTGSFVTVGFGAMHFFFPFGCMGCSVVADRLF